MSSNDAAADADTKCTDDSQKLQKDGVGEEKTTSTSNDESIDEGVIYGQDMNERIGPGYISLDQETLDKLQNNDPSVTKV